MIEDYILQSPAVGTKKTFIDFIIFAITPVLFRFDDLHAMNNMRMGHGLWDTVWILDYESTEDDDDCLYMIRARGHPVDGVFFFLFISFVLCCHV